MGSHFGHFLKINFIDLKNNFIQIFLMPDEGYPEDILWMTPEGYPKSDPLRTLTIRQFFGGLISAKT